MIILYYMKTVLTMWTKNCLSEVLFFVYIFVQANSFLYYWYMNYFLSIYTSLIII